MLQCPSCTREISIVLTSRKGQGNYIYRRRECQGCGISFTTAEVATAKSKGVYAPKRKKKS